MLKKSVAFVCTWNKVKNTNPFTAASKRMKYLGINLPRKGQNLLSETYKALLKEMKAALKKFFKITWPRTGRLNVVQGGCPPHVDLRVQHCSCVLSLFSPVWFFGATWTIAFQAPWSMGFSRQEYWSGLPGPTPGIFLTQGMNLHLFCLCIGRQALYHQGPLGNPSTLNSQLIYL